MPIDSQTYAFRATLRPIEEPYPAAEIIDINPDNPAWPMVTNETNIMLPRKLGHRIVALWRHYFQTPECSTIRPKKDYNCHIFGFAAMGWLAIGNSDPNFCAGSGEKLLLKDDYPQLQPEDIAPGALVGIANRDDPPWWLHTLIALEGNRHIAVQSNGGRAIIADTSQVQRYYEKHMSEAMAFYAITDRPSAIGTLEWQEEIIEQHPHNPGQAQRKIDQINTRLRRDERAYPHVLNDPLSPRSYVHARTLSYLAQDL